MCIKLRAALQRTKDYLRSQRNRASASQTSSSKAGPTPRRRVSTTVAKHTSNKKRGRETFARSRLEYCYRLFDDAHSIFWWIQSVALGCLR